MTGLGAVITHDACKPPINSIPTGHLWPSVRGIEVIGQLYVVIPKLFNNIQHYHYP